MSKRTSAPASGYSADTEILTRRGWVTFDQLTYLDEVATRSPKTRAIEWQQPTFLDSGHFSGEMINFHSRMIDLRVTPDFGVLIPNRPRRAYAEPCGDDWLIRADDLARRDSTYRILPMTAMNEAQDLRSWRVPSSAAAGGEYVTFDGGHLIEARKTVGLMQRTLAERVGCVPHTVRRAEAGGTIRLRLAERIREALGVDFTPHSNSLAFTEMSGDDYAAFMGMWLAEGSLNWHGEIGKRRRPSIYVTQATKSRGFIPYGRLLSRILGCEPAYNGHSFYFRHSALAEYLRQFGHAHEKYAPDEIKAMSPRQLMIFWRYYWLGDGHAERNRISTSSPRMADDLQQIAAFAGRWATVRYRAPCDGTLPGGRRITAERSKGIYSVAWHDYQEAVWYVRKVAYGGSVYSVSVPNGTLYVRRNGMPVWSGRPLGGTLI